MLQGISEQLIDKVATQLFIISLVGFVIIHLIIVRFVWNIDATISYALQLQGHCGNGAMEKETARYILLKHFTSPYTYTTVNIGGYLGILVIIALLLVVVGSFRSNISNPGGFMLKRLNIFKLRGWVAIIFIILMAIDMVSVLPKAKPKGMASLLSEYKAHMDMLLTNVFSNGELMNPKVSSTNKNRNDAIAALRERLIQRLMVVEKLPNMETATTQYASMFDADNKNNPKLYELIRFEKSQDDAKLLIEAVCGDVYCHLRDYITSMKAEDWKRFRMPVYENLTKKVPSMRTVDDYTATLTALKALMPDLKSVSNVVIEGLEKVPYSSNLWNLDIWLKDDVPTKTSLDASLCKCTDMVASDGAITNHLFLGDKNEVFRQSINNSLRALEYLYTGSNIHKVVSIISQMKKVMAFVTIISMFFLFHYMYQRIDTVLMIVLFFLLPIIMVMFIFRWQVS